MPGMPGGWYRILDDVVPTGEKRHRVERSWLGRYKLVLQIQEKYIWRDMREGKPITYSFRWRDAAVNDVAPALSTEATSG